MLCPENPTVVVKEFSKDFSSKVSVHLDFDVFFHLKYLGMVIVVGKPVFNHV